MPDTLNEAIPSGSSSSESRIATSEIISGPLYPNSYDLIGALKGRREILTATRTITEENVLDELKKAVSVHDQNVKEINFLWDYYRGDQPIYNRVKEVRPEICSKIVENHADEIVSFNTGYSFGEPYVLAGRSEDDCSEEIQMLNAWNSENDHDAKDMELGTWLNVSGTCYKIVIPVNDAEADTTEITSPYIVSVLDPREAFVVYYNGIQKVPVMGVKVVPYKTPEGTDGVMYCVYTENSYFEFGRDEYSGQRKPARKANPLGMVPIVEYQRNLSRRGAIEPIIPLQDALNSLASNRMDGVEQFIQSLMIFRNVDVDSKDVEKLQAMGAIKYRDTDPSSPGEVKYLVAELNQEGAQTLKDDLYESIVIISGLPSRNSGGGGTSDNVGAVIYRDGWSAAETKAKELDKYYERSEKNLLKIILRICREVKGFNLHLSNIKIMPTRKNYENTTSKATVLTTMLGSDKIAPRLAFNACGMFTDPEAAWKESKEYYEEHRDEEQSGTDTGSRSNSETGVSGTPSE